MWALAIPLVGRLKILETVLKEYFRNYNEIAMKYCIVGIIHSS